MPTAGGQARSPAEQLLELIANKDLFENRIREHERIKSEAEEATLALGEREVQLSQIQAALTDREAAVARREAIVDSREKELAMAEDAHKMKRAKWRALIPQIAELVK